MRFYRDPREDCDLMFLRLPGLRKRDLFESASNLVSQHRRSAQALLTSPHPLLRLLSHVPAPF
jgi:hypothetical protein